MQEILLKKRYFERELSKSLKKVYFFFWTQSLLMDRVIKIKRGLELVTSRSASYKTSSEKLLMLSDQVWWYNIKEFLSYSKNYICKFMQANSWHHKLFYFHLPFWIWKVWKGRETSTKNRIYREPKELFRWNKKHL